MVAFAEHGGFAQRPAQVGIAEFGSTQSLDLARTRYGSLDQAAVAQEVFDAGKALDVFHFVEDGQCYDLADAGDGAQQRELARVAFPGEGEQFLFQRLDGVVEVDDQCHILLQGEALAGIVGGFEQCFEPLFAVVAELGNGRLVARELAGADALEQLDALPDVGGAQAQQGADGALVRGIGVAGGDEIAAQQMGEFLTRPLRSRARGFAPAVQPSISPPTLGSIRSRCGRSCSCRRGWP